MHDVAHGAAVALLDAMEGFFREEQRREAYEAFYERVRDALRRYDESGRREAARLGRIGRKEGADEAADSG